MLLYLLKEAVFVYPLQNNVWKLSNTDANTAREESVDPVKMQLHINFNNMYKL